MIDDYIPHKNLENPSNIIENSKKTANTIFNNDKFANINQQIKDQNEYLNELKNEIEFDTMEENNINFLSTGNDSENIKLSIYQRLTLVSNQLSKAKEQIKFLTQENNSLKNIIANKDKIISDFEDLSLQFKQKYEKLESINNNLKQQLMSQNYGNQKNNAYADNNYNYNYDYKRNNLNDINYYKNANKIDDIDNYRNVNNMNSNNIRYNENENINDYNMNNKNDNKHFNDNDNLQMKNRELIYSINNIKKDLDLIENEYQIKLREKDCYIEQINCELINVYKEYVKLSDILEELNYIVKNSNYNELKTEFNCLLREKEILLKEKEKDHMEILSLREKFMQKPYDSRNLKNGNSDNKDSNELIKMFDEKEKNYINEIDGLKKNLVEKINEIEELKNIQENMIHEYQLKIEELIKNH